MTLVGQMPERRKRALKTLSSHRYEKRKHSVVHIDFKQRMNDLFQRLLIQYIPKGRNIMYLDSIARETTNTLKDVFIHYKAKRRKKIIHSSLFFAKHSYT